MANVNSSQHAPAQASHHASGASHNVSPTDSDLTGLTVPHARHKQHTFTLAWIFLRYQLITKALLSLILIPLAKLASTRLLQATGQGFFSSGELGAFLTPAGVALSLLGLLGASLVMGIDLFAFIHISASMRTRGEALGIWQALKCGLKSVPRFANLSGLLVILYILIVMPLIGLGLTSTVTEQLQIPSFIQSAISNSALYSAVYLGALLVLTWIGLRYIFTLHEVILPGKSPLQALRASRVATRGHTLSLIARLLWRELVALVAFAGAFLALFAIIMLAAWGLVSAMNLSSDVLVIFLILTLFSLLALFSTLTTPWLVDILTREWQRLAPTEALSSTNTAQVNTATGKASRKAPRVMQRQRALRVSGVGGVLVLTLGMLFAASAGIAADPTLFAASGNTAIVAHRAGGDLGPENTIEGMEAAIAEHADGVEIDVQRTKDGAYVIGHDTSFKRVAASSQYSSTPIGELTLEQVKTLNVTSPKGSAPVPTLEEFLDAARGHTHVYVELKGSSADQEMAAYVVQALRERSMLDSAMILSLDYPLISSVEKQWPEVSTGFLYYFSFGDVTQANVDLLVMEEGLASPERIESLHELGRKAYVWTVNTPESAQAMLSRSVDGVITDHVLMVEEEKERLRTESALDRTIDALIAWLS